MRLLDIVSETYRRLGGEVPMIGSEVDLSAVALAILEVLEEHGLVKIDLADL